MSKKSTGPLSFVAREAEREALLNFKRDEVEETLSLKADAISMIDEYLDKLPKGRATALSKDEMHDFIRSAAQLDVGPSKLQKFKLANEAASSGEELRVSKEIVHAKAKYRGKLPAGKVAPLSKDKMKDFITTAREIGAVDLAELKALKLANKVALESRVSNVTKPSMAEASGPRVCSSPRSRRGDGFGR